MFIPKLHFGTLEEIIEGALEEGNYFTGYKKYFTAFQLEPEAEAKGMEIVRLATNNTQTIYRLRSELVGIQKAKQAAAIRMYNDRREGKDVDESALGQFDRDIKKLEHKILIRAYENALLREPLDNFLAEEDIPVRDKYNKGRNQSDD